MSVLAHAPAGVRAEWHRTFSSLSVPNYRRFFTGQAISLVGTWMQSVAQSWLVLVLTGSGSWLGLVIAAQTLPVLLLGPYAGVLVDRADKRRLLVITQTVKGLDSLTLGILVLTGVDRLWMVFALAVLFGFATACDNPARQSFVQEMAGPDEVRNAVTLNSVMVNVARALGPAIAGVLIATIGIGVCFLVDAGSYVAVLVSLHLLDVTQLFRGAAHPRAPHEFRAGLAYVRRTPALVVTLLLMAVVGTLAYEFQVSLPVLARETFHTGASGYGLMTSAMGVGAVLGGLRVAGRGRSGLGPVVLAAFLFGLMILLTSVAPTLPLALGALFFVGATSVSFMAISNTTLQLSSAPYMRGRVMALWSVAFLGSTPIGGPVIGFISQHAGARWGLAVGGVAAVVAATIVAAGRWRRRRNRTPSPPPAPAGQDTPGYACDMAGEMNHSPVSAERASWGSL